MSASSARNWSPGAFRPDSGTGIWQAVLWGDAVLADALVRELLDARLVAVLATAERDGSIHAIPMWFAFDSRCVLLATGSGSRKARNLERDPRATLVVHDSRSGSEVCGVSLRGTAELVRGVDATPLVELVQSRYVELSALRLPAVAAFLGSDDVAIRFTPLSAVTWDERENEASAALRRAGGALPLEPTTPR